MIDKINKSITSFQELFNTKFKQSSQEAIEIMLMLACGHIFEIFTPNQLAQTLGIDKNKVYDAINSWSVFQFRKVFLYAGFSQVKELLNEAITKSPATLSRMRITLCVDDTVIDRMGKLIRVNM